MKKYVHWIKINGYTTSEETAKQFEVIDDYLKKYPNSNAITYEYDSGSFNWIVRLECEQNYRNLDMEVNSGSTYLTRLQSKPKNIGRKTHFIFPEPYRKYVKKVRQVNKNE